MRLGLNVNQYAHYCDIQVCDTACCICVFLNCAHMYILITPITVQTFKLVII